jgi:uncharacterized protein (TIGR02246 family)
MYKILLIGILCYFSVFTTLFGIDPENVKKEEVKNRLKEISAAVQQHDTDLLMSYWTKDAQWVNPDTGKTLRGRQEIAASLQKRTQEIEERQYHLAITPGNITFPASDKAVVEAIAEIKDNKGQLVQRYKREITLVKQDGKWYVQRVKEVEKTPPSPVSSR